MLSHEITAQKYRNNNEEVKGSALARVSQTGRRQDKAQYGQLDRKSTFY